MNKKNTLLTVLAVTACFLLGCASTAPITATPEEAAKAANVGAPQKPLLDTGNGAIIPNPIFTENVDIIGDTLGAFGVPYAGLAGTLAGLATTGLAAFENARRKRRDAELDKAFEEIEIIDDMLTSTVKAIEKSGDKQTKENAAKLAANRGVAKALDVKVKNTV